MERIDFINLNRIIWCCRELGITPYELANEVGLSNTTMENFIEKDAGLTFTQLKSISEYFGRGILFFLESEDLEPERVHTPAFRTLTNQKPELTQKVKLLIERVERQREVYLALNENLDGERKEFEPPVNLVDMNIAEAARVTRRWLGLRNTNNFESYREAIEAKNILVFRSNGYSGKWQIAKESPIIGFVLYDPICPVIVIKKQNAETQQAFTLMHELAHLLLHRASSIDDEKDLYEHAGMESEANAFAGHVLVPPELLNAINDSERPQDVSQLDVWLDVYKKRWGVSVEVILRRLMDSGRLDKISYGKYRKWRSEQQFPVSSGGNREWRHREPEHIFGAPFVRTVLDSLSSNKITITKASKYLDGIKLKDIHQLEAYYAQS